MSIWFYPVHMPLFVTFSWEEEASERYQATGCHYAYSAFFPVTINRTLQRPCHRHGGDDLITATQTSTPRTIRHRRVSGVSPIFVPTVRSQRKQRWPKLCQCIVTKLLELVPQMLYLPSFLNSCSGGRGHSIDAQNRPYCTDDADD